MLKRDGDGSLSIPWEILGLEHQPNRIEDIHAAYEARKTHLDETGDLMGQLGLENAYLNALALWERDDDYSEKAVKTDIIFEELVAEHAKNEPLSADELQEIGTYIMRTLHNPWQRNSIESWSLIFEIDPADCPNDQQFENLLREALLRYFGYYDDRSGQRNKLGGPRLMQTKIAQYIFARAGWTNQDRTTSEKERRELNWLGEELDVWVSFNERRKAGFHDFYLIFGSLFGVLLTFFLILKWIKGA